MIRQTGNLGAFVTALFNNNLALLGRALEDVVVEPQRAQLIPGFHKVKAAALSKGALGAGISGAGPSMYALCDNLAQARSITTSMQQVFEQHGIPSNGYASAINTQGAVRL